MEWSAPQKPAELAENRLVEAILEGVFPAGSNLPGERELAARLKVTRPTLREALQRLGRDGWLEIRQGRPTRVRDYWREGNLAVLSAIANRSVHPPPEFIPNLLTVRLALAPAYARLAVLKQPETLREYLASAASLPDVPSDFARFDWELHHLLTVLSGNPVFTLILNGFAGLYIPMAELYFQLPDSRRSSRQFYHDLGAAAAVHDPDRAEAVMRQVMQDSLILWNRSGALSGAA